MPETTCGVECMPIHTHIPCRVTDRFQNVTRQQVVALLGFDLFQRRVPLVVMLVDVGDMEKVAGTSCLVAVATILADSVMPPNVFGRAFYHIKVL